MIINKTGSIFSSQAPFLVNTVNCVGVMGKGLALTFKRRFPKMFEDYRNGGLDWKVVRPLIEEKLSNIESIIELYPPLS